MKEKKRDAAYLKSRLKRDHPEIHKSLEAGHISSVNQAAILAGLKRPPTRFDALKREWNRASAKERSDFERWMAGATAASPETLQEIVDVSGILTAEAAEFLKTWVKSRKVSPGRIMKELGFSHNDYRLAEALNRPKALKPEILRKLEPWLRKKGFR